MNGLSIKARLIILVVALLFLMTLACLVGLLRQHQDNGFIDRIYNGRIVALTRIQAVAAAHSADVLVTSYRVRDGQMSPESAAQTLVAARSMIDRQWKDYTRAKLVGRESELAAQAGALMQPVNRSVDHLLERLRNNDADSVRSLVDNDMYPAIEPLSKALNQLIRLQTERAQQEYENAREAYKGSMLRSAISLVMILGVTALSCWKLIRSITAPLADAVRVAETVASGDLSSHIEVTGRDETSQLMTALQSMSVSLQQIVGGVRTSSERIGVATKQIAAGNIELSSRTEQQAASLEETAASMEQLTGTVRQNAGNALQASKLAVDASTIALRGNEVVGRVVDTMGEISESSAKIREITTIIESIAFQTNILALNAAVEAARAGEQGRGFAVVASEVRGLAQRSSVAAKEIKELIGTSVARVAVGTDLVDSARESMQEIIGAVSRVTAIMGEIAAASEEQSHGIEQVVQAVSHMDGVAQQNAALVEEAAAAAQSLEDEAGRLDTAVAVFRLN